MRWNRIVFKISGLILLLFFVVLLPLEFVMDRIFTGFYAGQVQSEIDRLAGRYAQSIAASGEMMTVSMIEMMAGFSDIKLYITDSDGQVVANSGVPGMPKGSVLPDADRKTLLAGGTVHKEYEDPVLKTRFLVSGKPIMAGTHFYGSVYVLASVEGIDQSLTKVRGLIILSGIGAVFLALGFTYVLSRKLSDPLVQMEQATRRIAKGDLNARVEVLSRDEVGSLAHAINDLAKDLQMYRDTRSEFFANISHELRTPVTYLEGYAKVLKEGLYQTEQEKEQYLDIMYQESLRLSRLIHDLSELSKMEEGKIELQLEWIDLGEVLENSLRKTALKARQKGLLINRHMEGDLPLVYADGLRMEQIFINLIDNAVRYTEAGSIQIQLKRIEPNQLMVTVADTGMGISESELPHIFERFYRVEKSRSREYGGSGLGLAIVKNLVELQGGTITVSSQEGLGTCFEMRFPTESDNQTGEGSA